MVSKELISLLSALSPKEVIRFENFLRSPYSNKNEKLIELFVELKQFYPLFSNPVLSNHFIHSQIYPNHNFHDSTIRNLCSELKQAVERFLVVESLNTNAFYASDILLKEFRERNLGRLFWKKLQSSRDELENEGLSSSYFEKKYSLENHVANFKIMYDGNSNKSVILERINNLSESAKFLFINFALESQVRFLKAKMYENKFNITSQDDFLSALMDQFGIVSIANSIDTENYKDHLTLYARLLNMFLKPNNINNYSVYKSLYEKLCPKLSKAECGFHNSQLINFCNMKLNIMDESHDFKGDLHFLYKELVEFEYYKSSDNDLMPANLFRNIVLRALKSRDYEWTERFINTHYNKISTKERKNIVNLSLFLLYGYTDRNELALRFLNKIKLDNFIFKYDEYLLKIKIFYELEMFDEGLCTIHSFSEFVHNDTFESDELKQKYINFIKTSLKLFLFKAGKSEIELDYLMHKLLQKQNVAYKEWLLEKMTNELKNVTINYA
jgi:hypothetical protein